MTARYVLPLVGVAATTGMIALMQRWLGIPPLILLVVPIATSMQLSGVGPTLVAVASAALIGDYLFVEPFHEVTVHTNGLRLLLCLAMGAGVGHLTVRWTCERASRNLSGPN